jgi:hypothetical protein
MAHMMLVAFYRELPKPCIAFMGYALLSTWTSSLFFGPMLKLSVVTTGFPAIVALIPLGIVALIAFLIAVFANILAPIHTLRLPTVVMGGFGLVGTGLIFMSRLGILPSFAEIVGYVLAAIAVAWLTLVWWEISAAQGSRGAVLLLLFSVVVGATLFLLLAVVPQPFGAVLSILAPLVCSLSTVLIQVDNFSHLALDVVAIEQLRSRQTVSGTESSVHSCSGNPVHQDGPTHPARSTSLFLFWVKSVPFKLLVLVALTAFVNAASRVSGSFSMLDTSLTPTWLSLMAIAFIGTLFGGILALRMNQGGGGLCSERCFCSCRAWHRLCGPVSRPSSRYQSDTHQVWH